MLLLCCPKCKHTMKYEPRIRVTNQSKKRCVYCGKTYNVTECIVKK